MAMTKQQVSNQTVSKHYGYSAQVLSDWKRSSKVEHNRRVEALYDAYKKFLKYPTPIKFKNDDGEFQEEIKVKKSCNNCKNVYCCKIADETKNKFGFKLQDMIFPCWSWK